MPLCSYYSLKETSEQSHRALHKVVVDYAGTLAQPVKPVIDLASDSQADNGSRRARAWSSHGYPLHLLGCAVVCSLSV